MEEPPSGVLWGAAALALIGTATALALEQKRRREEEEARLREEMQERNAAQRAREAAEAAAIATARQAQEATEAALLAAERSSDEALEWQEDELAARDAGRDQAVEAHADAAARRQAERIAAAVAAEEARREIEEGRNEPVPGTEDNVTAPQQTGVGSLLRRIFGAARSAESSYEASALQFGDLDGGYVSVSGSQDFSQAARANTRAAWDLRGTRYRPDTVAGRVRGGLIGRAVSRGSILFSAGTALLGNLIDYGLGEHRETGVVSPEFAVSTIVDFGLSVLIGLASAGAVALAMTFVGATLPVWGAVAATAGVALIIGGLLDSAHVGDSIKQWLLTAFTG